MGARQKDKFARASQSASEPTSMREASLDVGWDSEDGGRIDGTE